MTAIAKRFVSDLDQLRYLEGIIEAGSKTFMTVGNALLEIDDKKLWQHAEAPTGEAGYANFNDYRERKWGMKITDRHARQLIKNSKTASKVGRKHASAITSNRQLTELGKVPEEKIEEVLDTAIEQSDGKPLTAKAIEKAHKTNQAADNLLSNTQDADTGDEADDEPEVEPETKAPQNAKREASWDAISDEALEIGETVGSLSRMADFIDAIAAEVSAKPALAVVRLENLAVAIRSRAA